MLYYFTNSLYFTKSFELYSQLCSSMAKLMFYKVILHHCYLYGNVDDNRTAGDSCFREQIGGAAIALVQLMYSTASLK